MHRLAEKGNSGMKLHRVTETLDVNDADLSGSQFNDANLSGARIQNVNLSGARFDNCRMTGVTIDGVPVEEMLAVFRQSKA
jgi:uncharacterized protein YjbI with pentapeptide repeats